MIDRWPSIPVQRAREVRQRLGLYAYPVDSAAVVKELDIDLKEIDADETDFDGCALKVDGIMGILVNAGIPYPARKNFTIAHELGHCMIETHLDPEYRCTSRSINAFDPKNPVEVEASAFAAELLMPESEFNHLAGRVSMSITGIKEIADRFGTSLSATSIRYTRLSPDQCAVILSDRDGILWSVVSRRFPFEIRRGALSDDSFAIDFFAGKTLPPRSDAVIRSAWARDGAARPEIPLFEESRQFERLGLVLTLLTVKTSDDDGDEEEDDSFED